MNKQIIENDEIIKFILGDCNDESFESKPSIILTSKRVYFSGEHFRYDKGHAYGKTFGREVVPINDFIGAGFIHTRNSLILYYMVVIGVIISFLFRVANQLTRFGVVNIKLKVVIAILAVIFMVLLFLYLFKKYKFFELAFIGKRICVKEKHFTKHEIQEFIEIIYNIKRRNKL